MKHLFQKGYRHSESTKDKLRQQKIGNKNPMYGKKLPEKLKENLRKINTGNKYNLGRKHTKEWKIKQSERVKNQWKSGKRKYSLNSGYRKRHPSYLTEKSKKKMSENHRAEKAYNYKGGQILNIQIRKCFKYRQWRSDIFTRDNFTCQKCGDNNGGNLEAHHIKEFAKILEEYQIKTLEEALVCEELWNINNGITLCEECHKKYVSIKS